MMRNTSRMYNVLLHASIVELEHDMQLGTRLGM